MLRRGLGFWVLLRHLAGGDDVVLHLDAFHGYAFAGLVLGQEPTLFAGGVLDLDGSRRGRYDGRLVDRLSSPWSKSPS